MRRVTSWSANKPSNGRVTPKTRKMKLKSFSFGVVLLFDVLVWFIPPREGLTEHQERQRLCGCGGARPVCDILTTTGFFDIVVSSLYTRVWAEDISITNQSPPAIYLKWRLSEVESSSCIPSSLSEPRSVHSGSVS